MAKIVSQLASTLLSRRTGTEPTFVVGINWDGLNTTWYSSLAGTGYNNNIQEVGSARNAKRNDSMCNVASVSVKFSDTDGAMKFIIDNRNAEKAPAVVFLAYAGTAPTDFVELIRGQVTAPINWDEGSRTLDLTIESVIETRELGYSATIEDYTDMSPDAQGIPWPMIFGTCAHVPALQIRKKTTGHLMFPIRLYKNPSWGFFDDGADIGLIGNPEVLSYITEEPVSGVIYVDGGSRFPQDEEIQIAIGDVIFKGTMSGNNFTVSESNAARFSELKFGARGNAKNDGQNNKVAWLADDKISIVNHHCYLQAPGGYQWYNYCVKQVGKKCWFRFPFISPVTEKSVLISSSNTILAAYGISLNGMVDDIGGTIIQEKTKTKFRRKIAQRHQFGHLVSLLTDKTEKANSWWQASADEEVRLWNQEDPDIYIASLIELEEIKAVYGKRKINTPDGKTKEIFASIPTTYYTEQLQSGQRINGNFASALIFEKSLTDYAGQDWTGEVYVTAKSTVGPNSVKIVEWILDNYTDLNTDPSFEHVQNLEAIESREAHFALFDKRDALRVAQEISYQSRCALIMDSERIGIRFLAETPTQQYLFTLSNTLLGSMKRSFTPTLDVATKTIATWTETYREMYRVSQLHQKKVGTFQNVLNSLVPSNRRTRSETRYSVYEENVEQYGLKPRDENCYIYPVEENVQAFLEFWGHRYANSWQLVMIQAPLGAAILQPFDGVVFNYTDVSLLQTTLIKGVVEEVTLDPKNMTVDLVVWLPRVAGSNFVDSKAWPES